MIFPTTYLGNVLLLILALVCLGSWINTLKLTYRHRFELYSYDFAFGVLLAGVIAAFTFGMLDSQELTFQDNLLLTGYRKMAWAVGAGMMVGVGNVLTVAGVSIAGISVAFPLSLGIGFSIATIWETVAMKQGNVILLGLGILLILVAIVAGALSSSWQVTDEGIKAQKAFIADPRVKAASKKKPSQIPGIVLAVLGGIFMGAHAPMLQESVVGENGVGAYAFILLFAVGLAGSTIVSLPFFMNFPVQGQPLKIRQYFKSGIKQHLLGLTGGVIFTVGFLAPLVAAGSPASAQVSPIAAYVLSHAFPVLAALWGIMLWKESKDASNRVQMARNVMMVLFLAGVGMIAVGRVTS